MYRHLALSTLNLRWPLLLGLALITFWMGDALLRLRIDPSTDSLFVKTSREYQRYREFNERFGSDYMIALAMETPDLFEPDKLAILQELTDKIAAYPQVERVASLANAHEIRHRFLGVKVVPALGEVYKGEQKPEEARDRILDNELFRHNLVSADGRIANLLIFLKPADENRESSGILIRNLHKLLERYENEFGVHFYMAGAPIEQYEFIRLIRRDQMIFIPAITLLLILTTWLIYRNFACMVLSMTTVFMTLVWTMGSIERLGYEINLVTSLLAPVIMIIAVVNSIHLMNLFFEIRVSHTSLRESIALTMSQLGAPCFLTHFTTILGFLSLALNPVPAIRNFGLLAALGTLFSYVIEMVLTPLLLMTLPYRQPKDHPSEHFFNRFIVAYLEKVELRWKWFILAATVLLIGLSFVGFRRLEVDTSLIRQMKPDTPLAISTRFIDENITGVYVLGFVLQKRNGAPMTDYETLSKIEKLKKFLEDQPEIVNVNSITTVLKRIHQARENESEAYRLPEDNDTLKTYLEGLMESRHPDLLKLITADFRQIRLGARMKAVGTEEGTIMEERIMRYMAENFSNEFEYDLTGNIVLLGKMAKNLVRYQIRGFGFAFISILVLITIMFRSIRMGVLAAVPNLIPIVAIYGIMGFAGIELSSPTAMISSIVLGMVVDASIHFLHRFRLEFERRGHYLQSLHHTYRNVGQSLVVSTVILCAGFASSVFASFRPTVLLGVLTSLTIFIALVCTLIVLPVCLLILKPFGPERLFRKSGAALN